MQPMSYYESYAALKVVKVATEKQIAAALAADQKRFKLEQSKKKC